ncbi:MAG: Stp1/IreP family PP2C-type Ser/Thr phosphatase [Saprospiraceae bacterium]
MAFSFLRKQKAEPHPKNQAQVSIDYRAVALTDVGSVRDNNEDHLVFTRPFDVKTRASHGCLALVADGMGGHSFGELASRMAAEIITRHYFDTTYTVLTALQRAFEKANKAIFQQASKATSYKGMGTTCTAVVLLNNQIYLGHVGDSRAYLFKGDQMIQLSNDHTLVQHLLDTGQITQEESLGHPQRNVVTRAMGTSAKLQADFSLHKLCFEEGDKLLICSDGLYEYVKGDELKSILRKNNLNEAAQSLIHLAKQRGGHDNISVLIAETFSVDTAQVNKPTQKITIP